MKATGIVRRIDDLGRIVIPKEIRRTLHIRETDPMEIFTDAEGQIILKKYSPIGDISTFAGKYAESLSDATGMTVCITDRQIIRTFILVNISWYFDNAATLTDAFRLMGNTFKHASFSMDAVVKMFGSQLDLIILLAGCLVWLIISILKEKGIVIREALDRKPLIIRWAVYIALVMSVAMLGYISNTSGGFMYAQF